MAGVTTRSDGCRLPFMNGSDKNAEMEKRLKAVFDEWDMSGDGEMDGFIDEDDLANVMERLLGTGLGSGAIKEMIAVRMTKMPLCWLSHCWTW